RGSWARFSSLVPQEGRWEGGMDTESLLSSRPYMAYVQIGSTESCGGFLIQEDVVVTAAHCNLDGDVTSHCCTLLQALPLSYHLPSRDLTLTPWTHIHPTSRLVLPHSSSDTCADPGLFSLSHPWQLWDSAELTEWVVPIPLPEANHHVSPGTECSVAGWGQTGVNTTTNRLLEVEQEVVSDGLCKDQYQHYNPTTMLCAGSPHGDSGGPLVCDGVVQGIVSNGNPDGRPPSIYTRISKFIPWINETLQKLS
uniref:Peptidase S1 domain-containing protein n=1 Tax=Gopherus agassizii TaxID=38772 RepID=A0A452IEZ0_9SAUR